MKMTGMADALQQQLDSGSFTKLSFEERLGMLLDAEYAEREQRKLTRRLQRAKLRQSGACIEDVDFKTRRSLNRQAFMALARCDWIGDALNVVITGATGTGKTYLACALANKACRAGFTAYYVRGSQLPQQMAIARGDGSYPRTAPPHHPHQLADHRRLATDATHQPGATRDPRGHRGSPRTGLHADRLPATDQCLA